MDYEQLTNRNHGYIATDLQYKIKDTTLLFAGSGLGSIAAEVAIRTGFEKFILVDGDTVSATNLNRQIYKANDIGETKVDALKNRLLSINPNASILAMPIWLDENNVHEVVKKADVVIDTIDFLDLKAILSLHDSAYDQEKPVISSFSCAFGSFCTSFIPKQINIRQFFNLKSEGCSIVEVFKVLLKKYRDKFPQEFLQTTDEVLRHMLDGTSCPAPQLAIGSYCAGALMITRVIQYLKGEKIVSAPDFDLINLNTVAA